MKEQKINREQFLKAEKDVTAILETNIEARKSDQALFIIYWKNKAKHIPFKLFFLCPSLFNSCSFKTIERVRRKIQSQRPELKDKYVAEKRLEATMDYMQYSIDM